MLALPPASKPSCPAPQLCQTSSPAHQAHATLPIGPPCLCLPELLNPTPTPTQTSPVRDPVHPHHHYHRLPFDAPPVAAWPSSRRTTQWTPPSLPRPTASVSPLSFSSKPCFCPMLRCTLRPSLICRPHDAALPLALPPRDKFPSACPGKSITPPRCHLTATYQLPPSSGPSSSMVPPFHLVPAVNHHLSTPPLLAFRLCSSSPK